MELKNITLAKKKNLAENPSTSKDVLRDLAKDEDWEVRWTAAKNPNTPVDALRYLSEEKSYEIRREVALNSNTKETTLRALVQDNEWFVRSGVGRNHHASRNVVITLFEYEKSLSIPDSAVIEALYAHPNLPHIAKVIIETLFGDMV